MMLSNRQHISLSTENLDVNGSEKCIDLLLEDDSTFIGEESNKVPEVGMTYRSVEEVKDYYKAYARRMGFGVMTRNSKKNDTGDVSYLIIACAREGSARPIKQNPLKPNPTIKQNYQARISVSLCNDGLYKVSTVHLDHNHDISPTKARHFRCNKKLDMHAKRVLELNDRVGIRLNKNFSSLVVEARGYNNMSYSEKECRNFIEKVRRLKLGDGDGEALMKYFARMQEQNTNFFYVMDMDDKFCVRNVFWADARTRATYEAFGEVVTFDTTYLTNKYDMPFAPFVGVNHHGQSVLLGCGLLSNEDTDTFVWLFKSWLRCMLGVPPKAIITDQCKAMQNAIQVVFPEGTRHRWCLWHIIKKLPLKLGSHTCYKKITYLMQNAVYDSLKRVDFEEKWNNFIEKYNLHNNKWLNGLYEQRQRWVSTFVKDSFWAGMSTTQRSESVNAFFDKYVSSTTSLKQFVDQYEKALRDKVEKDAREDYKSFDKTISCVSLCPIEKQFQEAYTHAKFMEIQPEFTGKLNCHASLVDEVEFSSSYDVREDALIAEKIRELSFNVTLMKDSNEVKCTCQLFEFRGILCRHVFVVLAAARVREVPQQYILRRWRKDIKRKHTYIKSSYDELKSQPQMERYDKLFKKFQQVVEFVADDESKCNQVESVLKQIITKMLKVKSYNWEALNQWNMLHL